MSSKRVPNNREYNIWHCPRCKYFEWEKRGRCVGICKAGKTPVRLPYDDGKSLMAHGIKRCPDYDCKHGNKWKVWERI